MAQGIGDGWLCFLPMLLHCTMLDMMYLRILVFEEKAKISHLQNTILVITGTTMYAVSVYAYTYASEIHLRVQKEIHVPFLHVPAKHFIHSHQSSHRLNALAQSQEAEMQMLCINAFMHFVEHFAASDSILI